MAGKSGLDMLLMQYSDSPNLRAYIQIFLDELKLVQDAQEEAIKYRYLADSFGVMVDDIAYLVGASRTIYGAAPLGYFGFYSDPSAFPAIPKSVNAIFYIINCFSFTFFQKVFNITGYISTRAYFLVLRL